MAVTITGNAGVAGSSGIKHMTLAWESSSGGSASQAFSFAGEIRRVCYVPGTVLFVPTTGYDVVCTDAAGFDVFSGTGANLSDTVKSEKVPCLVATDGTNTGAAARAINDTLTLSVTNAGDTKRGTIHIYFRDFK